MEAIERLLDRARKGESEALSLLYRRFLPGVFGYIAARVPERTLAEDLTADVFVTMVEQIARLKAKDEAGFCAWLLQIARTTVAGYYRKQGRRPVLLPLNETLGETEQGALRTAAADEAESDPVHQAEVRDEWERMVQAINSLTEEQRQVLIGRLVLGYDIATVARMVGKKANAVKSLQFRALSSLQRLLRKQDISGDTPRQRKEEK